MVLAMMGGYAMALPNPSEVEALIKNNQCDTAKNKVEEVLAAHPYSAKGWYIAAKAYLCSKDYLLAQQAFLNMKEIDPKYQFRGSSYSIAGIDYVGSVIRGKIDGMKYSHDESYEYNQYLWNMMEKSQNIPSDRLATLIPPQTENIIQEEKVTNKVVEKEAVQPTFMDKVWSNQYSRERNGTLSLILIFMLYALSRQRYKRVEEVITINKPNKLKVNATERPLVKMDELVKNLDIEGKTEVEKQMEDVLINEKLNQLIDEKKKNVLLENVSKNFGPEIGAFLKEVEYFAKVRKISNQEAMRILIDYYGNQRFKQHKKIKVN